MTGSGTINTDSSTTLTYGGVISDSGAITKSGQERYCYQEQILIRV